MPLTETGYRVGVQWLNNNIASVTDYEIFMTCEFQILITLSLKVKRLIVI